MEASIETGRLDDALPIAVELSHVLRKQIDMVEGVLDALSPDHLRE